MARPIDCEVQGLVFPRGLEGQDLNVAASMIALETVPYSGRMLGTWLIRLLLSTIVLCYFTVLYCSQGHAYFSSQELGSSPTPSPSQTPSPVHEYRDIRNSTLGVRPSRKATDHLFVAHQQKSPPLTLRLQFQDIFVLNLPSRTDKLDTFTLTSAATDFTFRVLAGVDGKTVPDKALTFTEGQQWEPGRRRRTIGSWRAHLNFARHIVRNRLATALLFEDDADWDVDLKAQLELVAQGTRALDAMPKRQHPWLQDHAGEDKAPKATPHSPYGDDWDLLWLGHCGVTLHQDSSQVFRIDNDPTVAPPHRRMSFKSFINTTAYPDSTRLVFRTGQGLCVYSYALSYRGAQKLLLNENNRKRFVSFDLSMEKLCGSGSSTESGNPDGGWVDDFVCLSVYPQIIDSHKPAGSTARDSDINTAGDVEDRERGYTFNILRSVRMNLDKLIAWGGWEAMRRQGEEAVAELEVQWNDQPCPSKDIQTSIEWVGELEPVKGMFD